MFKKKKKKLKYKTVSKSLENRKICLKFYKTNEKFGKYEKFVENILLKE